MFTLLHLIYPNPNCVLYVVYKLRCTDYYRLKAYRLLAHISGSYFLINESWQITFGLLLEFAPFSMFRTHACVRTDRQVKGAFILYPIHLIHCSDVGA